MSFPNVSKPDLGHGAPHSAGSSFFHNYIDQIMFFFLKKALNNKPLVDSSFEQQIIQIQLHIKQQTTINV